MSGFSFGKAKTGITRDKPIVNVLPDTSFQLISSVIDPNFILKNIEEPVTRKELKKDVEEGNRIILDQPESVIMENTASILSYEDILTYSVAEINNTNDEGNGSLYDPRMGTFEFNKRCQTCHQDNLSCPGHIGHIDFDSVGKIIGMDRSDSSVKIYHPGYIEEVVKVLKSVCRTCSRILIYEKTLRDKNLIRGTGAARLKLIADGSEGYGCCRDHMTDEEVMETFGSSKYENETIDQMVLRLNLKRDRNCANNPIYISSKTKELNKVQYKESKEKDAEIHTMSIDEVYGIFKAIPDRDLILLFGKLVHPVNFIMQAIPVIPPNHRPPRYINGNVSPDGITKKYQDIITCLNKIHDNKDSVNKTSETDKLFDLVRDLYYNNNKGKRTNDGYKSLIEQIQGKEGFMRGSLMGTKGNYVTRSVITPGPSLRYGQVGVPRIMKSSLTRQEIVCQYNIEALKKLMENGEITTVIHGNRRSTPGNRQTIKVGNEKFKIELRFGDTVERHLRNGDMVPINRQPTLHKGSMKAHEVVLIDSNAIQLHPGDTTSYNADHDGDEMNIYSFVGPEAAAEGLELMSYKQCLTTASSNNNIVGLILNSVSGAYILSDPTTMVSEDIFWGCVTYLDDVSKSKIMSHFDKCKKYRLEKFSGRSLFSLLLPPDFSYEKGSDDDAVIITDGILISGRLTKSHVGPLSHQSIPQVLFKMYGPDVVVRFITEATWVINEYLTERGFTVGIDDCFLPEKEKIDVIMREELGKTENTILALGGRRADPLEEYDREAKIINAIKAVENIGVRFKNEIMKPDNAIGIMVKSGAKGGDFNITQSIGIIGQQKFRGERIAMSISGGTRCLPHFKYDPDNTDSEDIDSRGFCRNSFSSGLSPTELHFHIVGGREGLMDIANNTPNSGYIHRRMIKALENIVVTEDRSVRNKSGVILQQVYGYDGFDASKLINVSSPAGNFPSFIDLKATARKLNIRNGWIPQKYMDIVNK